MAENQPRQATYAPILTDAQIDRIRAFGGLRKVAAGAILYQPNDETPSVFVVISGKITNIRPGPVFRRTADDLRPTVYLPVPGRRGG
jgi:hypothetical protein